MTDERSLLKHHFLKQLVFRMDFTNVMEEDIRKFIPELRTFYYSKGYNTLVELYTNKANLSFLNDTNNSSNFPFEVKDYEKYKIWRFQKENCTIDLCPIYFSITENISSSYTTFNQYSEIIENTIKLLNKTSEFFTCSRIGIRKINIGYIDCLPKLKKFFRSEILNVSDLEAALDGYGCMAANYNNLLFSSEIKTNYIRNIQFGNTTNESGDPLSVYQIILDIDSYVDTITPEMMTSTESTNNLITKINDTTFALYKKSLTPEFFENLKDENYIEPDFKGII